MALNQKQDELFIVISRTKDFDFVFERTTARTTDSMPGRGMGLVLLGSFADHFIGRDGASDKLLGFKAGNFKSYTYKIFRAPERIREKSAQSLSHSCVSTQLIFGELAKRSSGGARSRPTEETYTNFKK